MPGQVRIGTKTVGDTPALVVAGSGSGADIAWMSLRRHHGRADAGPMLAQTRESHPGPLLVEPFSAADLPAISDYADGVLVGAAWMQDFQLLRAVARTGLPVVIQRGPAATLSEWLSAAEYCTAEGNRDVVLCETGSRTHLPQPTIDLALLGAAKDRIGGPVLVDVSSAPELGVAALAAGADGLLLPEDADAGKVARIRERAAVLGPLLRPEETDSVAAARATIDRVDAALATLLERRATLAGVVQKLKPVGGFAGRDPVREQEIVAAMAERAPRLGARRLAPVVNAVIEAGLDLAEQEQSAERAAAS